VEAEARLTARIGVFGATGYAGREVVRLLRAHPRARVEFTTGTGGGHTPHEAGLEREADAYLLSLPHGVAASYVEKLATRFPRAVVIDLSGDLRLPTNESYKRWYGQDHPAPGLLGQVPFGLTEVYRERLVGARIISNPGCYATSMLLPLVPLLREKQIEADDIIIDAKSGASGAGRTLREDLLFCEVSEDFSAYAVGHVHRHVGEVEWILEEQTGLKLELTFCPHLLPVRRGILSAVYVRPRRPVDELAETLRRFYAGCAFVHVVSGKPPRLQQVAWTNDCLLSVHEAAGGRAVVFSAIDNLIKGAAGQAIQNLNVALGWPETDGLPVESH
jgi:N-acetyl-gamma-glutamyl-phosphate reductase